MKYIFIYLGLMLLLSNCSVNKKSAREKPDSYSEKYDAFLKEDETKTFAWYQGIYSRNKKGQFIERLFYPEKNQITSLINYKSKRNRIKDGTYIRWFDNGGKMEEGQYKNGYKSEVWQFYDYGSDILRTEGNYKEGLGDGKWKYYDSDGHIMVELFYRDGVKSGKFVEYDSLGNILNEGSYKADTIFEQSSNQEIYTAYELDTLNLVEELPYLTGCEHILDSKERKECSDKLLLKTIYENISYPSFAVENAVEGQALISFVIYEDGSVHDVVVLSGICESIEKECLRVLNLLPKWNPGKAGGEIVKVKHNLPVNFELN